MKYNNKKLILLLFSLSVLGSAEARMRWRKKKKKTKKTTQVQKKAAKQVKPVKSYSVKTVVDVQPYRLWVDGIECRVCAKTATVALKKLKGVKQPQYCWVEKDIKQSYGELKHDPKKFQPEPVETALRQHQFKLKGIKGRFYVSLKQGKNGKWYVVFPNDPRQFVVGDQKNTTFKLLKKKKTVLKKPLLIDGSLFLDPKHQQFFFS